MLGLKMPTDPRWVELVQQDILQILIDHAWCEQKAASNAISLIVIYPEYKEMIGEHVNITVLWFYSRVELPEL